jgi:uncharacterized YigZ family protein
MDRYQAPAKQQRFELDIKRSRFITTVIPTRGRHEALAALKRVQKEFADANHNCWAMIASQPGDVYHQDQSDDGEPKGTAGKPMLNVLVHSGLGNILVVVTRYFGGIKLGAGGLVRAYTQSATAALGQITTTTVFVNQDRQLMLAYPQLKRFEHWLKSTDITIASKTFGEAVVLQLLVPESNLRPLEVEVSKLRGTLSIPE